MSNHHLCNFFCYSTDVGKRIRSTKTRYTWEFTIDDNSHKVELYVSKISKKRKLLCDGIVINVSKDENSFFHSFKIDIHSISIMLLGELYELRINNQIFQHLMDMEKNKIYFNDNEKPISHVSQANPSFEKINNKTINFGIGVMNNFDSGKDKPALFNFSIKPSSEIKPRGRLSTFSNDENLYYNSECDNKENQLNFTNGNIENFFRVDKSSENLSESIGSSAKKSFKNDNDLLVFDFFDNSQLKNLNENFSKIEHKRDLYEFNTSIKSEDKINIDSLDPLSIIDSFKNDFSKKNNKEIYENKINSKDGIYTNLRRDMNNNQIYQNNYNNFYNSAGFNQLPQDGNFNEILMLNNQNNNPQNFYHNPYNFQNQIGYQNNIPMYNQPNNVSFNQYYNGNNQYMSNLNLYPGNEYRQNVNYQNIMNLGTFNCLPGQNNNQN